MEVVGKFEGLKYTLDSAKTISLYLNKSCNLLDRHVRDSFEDLNEKCK